MKKAVLFVFMLTLVSSMGFSDERENPREMVPFEKNGFYLAGSEYWPFIGEKDFSYPEDVLWGFRGESNSYGRETPATEAAYLCARRSYAALEALLENPPEELLRVAELGATTDFYLWTDDYSQDTKPFRRERRNQMWHWNSGEKDYSAGYWKWESVLKRDGRCLIPQLDQIRRDLRVIIDLLEG